MVTNEELAQWKLDAWRSETTPKRTLELIAEVERLRNEVDRLTAGRQDFRDTQRRMQAERKALLSEIERLREKCDGLTINGFQAELKQLDEARAEVERLKSDQQTFVDDALASREEVERLRNELAAVDSALGGTPTVVGTNSPTRAQAIRELGAEVERLRRRPCNDEEGD